MNRYITRGIANNLPITLQHQLWELVSEREQNNQKARNHWIIFIYSN